MDHTGYPELDGLLPRLAAIPALDRDALEAEHIAVLGRKQGALTAALRAVATLDPAQRKGFGAASNALKAAFEAAFLAREAELAAERLDALGPSVDLTMPGRARWVGALHPITRVVDEILAIFRELGFAVAVGPE